VTHAEETRPAPRTDHVRLARLDETHLSALRELTRDPDVLRFTRVPVPTPASFPEAWLARYEAGRRDGSREGFAILDAHDASFLGVALAPKIDREGKTVELGYVVAPHARGRGVATAALWRLTEWAFAELEARRIELLISVDNRASKIVARRCGYTFEGVLRGMHFKQDIWEDGEIWSRLSTDP